MNRTNNPLERYNREANKVCTIEFLTLIQFTGGNHPSTPRLIEILKTESEKYARYLGEVAAGHRSPKARMCAWEGGEVGALNIVDGTVTVHDELPDSYVEFRAANVVAVAKVVKKVVKGKKTAPKVDQMVSEGSSSKALPKGWVEEAGVLTVVGDEKTPRGRRVRAQITRQ
jgi:hypothetical protein